MHYRLNASNETKRFKPAYSARDQRNQKRRGVHSMAGSGWWEVPRLSGGAEAIENRVQALSADQLLDRYHELVDQRLVGSIAYRESFELDRIEARLNAEDQDEPGRLKILQDDWQRERDTLVTSIESLLTRLKVAR